jgi:hypothetical protein
MPGAQVTLRFTDRETAIFKAGQCLGGSEALKQSAEAMSRLTQRTAQQSEVYAKEGQKVFSSLENMPGESRGSVAGRALATLIRERIYLVANAMMGREPRR